MVNSFGVDPFAEKAAWLSLYEIICRVEPGFDFSDKNALIEIYSQFNKNITVSANQAADGFWLTFNSHVFAELDSRWVLDTIVNDNLMLANMYRFDLVSTFTVNGVQYAKFSDGLIVKISFIWEDKMFYFYNEHYGKQNKEVEV